MEKLINYLKNNNGYGRMKELKNNGIHTRTISKAVEKNIIEKIKPGLYKLVDFSREEYSSFIDIYRAKNDAVICLLSALEYYDLTTFNPSKITVAVPNNTDKFNLNYPPIEVYYFSNKMYSAGIQEIQKKNDKFKIYSPEKSIADIFRYRNKLGEDIALEALGNYLQKSSADINKLREFGKKCRVKTIINPYIKAMLNQ